MTVHHKQGLKAFTTIGALVGWFAVIVQFIIMMDSRTASVAETIIRFFSYFTILTNTLVAITFTLLMFNSSKEYFFTRPVVLTATTLYIVVVGLVYQLLLRGLWAPEGLARLVDELLHSFAPSFFLLFWVMYVPKRTIKKRHAISWLVYPAVYLVYVLLRGSVSGFYPYPFIDVTELGYTTVFINSSGMLVLFIMLGIILILLARLMRRKEQH